MGLGGIGESSKCVQNILYCCEAISSKISSSRKAHFRLNKFSFLPIEGEVHEIQVVNNSQVSGSSKGKENMGPFPEVIGVSYQPRRLPVVESPRVAASRTVTLSWGTGSNEALGHLCSWKQPQRIHRFANLVIVYWFLWFVVGSLSRVSRHCRFKSPQEKPCTTHQQVYKPVPNYLENGPDGFSSDISSCLQ